MVLRLSSVFPRTLRDVPADAEVASHQLLVRAGYVRRVAAGLHAWLPLGRRVLGRITDVVREELDAIGGQEVLLPALLPREQVEATGRWTEYGDELFRLRDRRGADLLLGPTHEELFTSLVRGEVSSYRELPLVLYQVQTKYRDELRPRGGPLRAREFTMADSYSFDVDDAGLARAYERHRQAFGRLFERLGVHTVAVAALSGAMGGSASEEFLAPTPAGEDTFAACPACGYAANAEAVEVAPPPAPPGDDEPVVVLDTPGTPTIDTLVECLNTLDLNRTFTAADTLKNVVVTVTPPASAPEVVVVGVPGDRDVDLARLGAALAPATVGVFTAEDFDAHPALVRGYLGPQVLADLGIRYLADPRVNPGSSWVTGANQPGRHAIHVVAGRDFTVDAWVAGATVHDGDPCPRCGTGLGLERGVEVGHVFRLGRRYTDALGLDVLGADGAAVRVTMGSYGIGVSRLVSVIVEQHHDASGIVWPPAAAPAAVHVVVATRDEAGFAAAEGLAASLEEQGRAVVLDDRRGVSAGVRFTDAELLGLPTIVVVGRGLAGGTVEVRDRASGGRRDVPLADVVGALVAA